MSWAESSTCSPSAVRCSGSITIFLGFGHRPTFDATADCITLGLWAPMNLVVKDSTQLCFPWMVARAGLMDSRKFRTAPSLGLHNQLCVWPELDCREHLHLDSVIYSFSSSSQSGAVWGFGEPDSCVSSVKSLWRHWTGPGEELNLSLPCHQAIKDINMRRCLMCACSVPGTC